MIISFHGGSPHDSDPTYWFSTSDNGRLWYIHRPTTATCILQIDLMKKDAKHRTHLSSSIQWLSRLAMKEIAGTKVKGRRRLKVSQKNEGHTDESWNMVVIRKGRR